MLRSAARILSRLPKAPKRALAAVTGATTAFVIYNGPAHAKINPQAKRIMEELHDKSLKNAKAFGQYQADGVINRKAFIQAFQDLGVSNSRVIGSFFDSFDKDRTGVISFEEFISALAMMQKGEDCNEALRFLFDCCDLNANGSISKNELNTLIHALMVTKENLMNTDEISQDSSLGQSAGPQTRLERNIKEQEKLSHHKRVTYASTGEKDDNDSIWDIYNKARLRNGPDYSPSSITTVSIAPTSLVQVEEESSPITKRELNRLEDIYKEFPELKGQSLDECLDHLSFVMSEQIFQSAHKSNNEAISFQDFQQWAGEKTHESEMLFGLFRDFAISGKGDETLKVAYTREDYENPDAFL